MKRQRIRRGFSFRHPDGTLDFRITESVTSAQDNAAFASERPYSHISMPSDWHRAYKQGFRIVPVTMTAGPSASAWKEAAQSAE